MTTSFIIYMFTLGLGTSLHCVSMCGPLVLTVAARDTKDESLSKKLTPNLVYQGAKLVSYMLVGLLLGTIGSALNLDSIRPYVMFIAGAFMIVLGLGMTGKVPWAAKLTPRPPQWLMNVVKKLRKRASAEAAASEDTLTTPLFFGLITGLFPCGPLIAAQIMAAASGSALAGGLGMAAFALGTAPLMIAFGTAGSLIPAAWKQRAMVVLAVGVMVFGLVFINRGLMLTGAPVNFDTLKNAVVGTQAAETTDYPVGADGVVEVPLVIENVAFSPSVLSIPADKPVRLVVDRREANACSDQLAIPQLGVLVNLAPNAVTNVELPAAPTGTYTLTCGMGMMSGQLAVGGAGTSGGSMLPWLLLAMAATAGAGWFAWSSGRRSPAASTASARKSVSSKRDTAKGSGSEAAPTLFGFKPTEVVLIGAAIGLAIVAGIVLGQGL